MTRPTALGIPSPWSGDEADPLPPSYWWWYRFYVATRRMRHLIGLHDYQVRRCTWCGKRSNAQS